MYSAEVFLPQGITWRRWIKINLANVPEIRVAQANVSKIDFIKKSNDVKRLMQKLSKISLLQLHFENKGRKSLNISLLLNRAIESGNEASHSNLGCDSTPLRSYFLSSLNTRIFARRSKILRRKKFESTRSIMDSI